MQRINIKIFDIHIECLSLPDGLLCDMNVASVDAFLRRYMYMVVLNKRDDENVQNRVSST